MAQEVLNVTAKVPASGVRLTGGLFARAFENNKTYLKSLSQDSILYWFRKKKGLSAPGEPYRGHFEDNIKGQTAGLFLMGAANSLRWEDDSVLRTRVEEIVDCIDTCKEEDGFLEPIPKSEFGTLEYPNYVRVWLNYGLRAASMVGSRKALPLMRGMQSWFNRCDERFLVKHLVLAFQGVIANTTVYYTDVGLPEDLEAVVQYYQEDWWLGQFIRRDDGAVHKRPTPHGTELEGITAYMDMYLATGKAYYLNAVNAAYRMFHDKWQHVGGGIVAIEHTDIAPGCLWLDPIHKYNELCCSAHWLYLNQRYHRLYPEEEKYVGEIEKTLYNIVIANQVGGEAIRYHAFIDVQKDANLPTLVSCCAGLGTRILGSLPEFLYSTAVDGVYVDIYADSTFTWNDSGVQCALTTKTTRVVGGEATVTVNVSAPKEFTIRARIPGWCTSEATVTVNGNRETAGKPGTYVAVRRTWRPGDTLALRLPVGLRVTEYAGLDTVPGCGRYALEHGPLLLGLTGPLDFRGRYIEVRHDPWNPTSWLTASADKEAHYRVKGKPNYEYVPYYEIGAETFSCYPAFPRKG